MDELLADPVAELRGRGRVGPPRGKLGQVERGLDVLAGLLAGPPEVARAIV